MIFNREILKTLIDTIISTFTDIQEFSLGCLFLFKNQFNKNTPRFEILVYYLFLDNRSLKSFVICFCPAGVPSASLLISPLNICSIKNR